MANYVTGTSDKNKNTALLLCLFGGMFGLHQFYVGRIGKGLLYCFTGGLLFFGVIKDLFKILLGTFTDNVGMPLRASSKNYKTNQYSSNPNMNINVTVPQQTQHNPNTNINIAEQLKKLADLKDSGILTEEEFNVQKSKLLSI